MTSLILTLLVIGVALAVLLNVGALFLQSYIYTTPSSGLAWQAPAAASVMFLFLLLWSVIIANSSTAAPSQVPYDSIFRFSPKVDMVKDPIPLVTAVQKNGTKTEYRLYKQVGSRPIYINKKDFDDSRKITRWRGDNVKEIRLKHEGQEMVFELTPTPTGGNREFVNADTGYIIVEMSGAGGSELSDIPVAFRWSRFLANMFLNFLHLTLWFACFWLLLRFQWSHALGLAVAAWLIVTLALLPMLLDNAAQVAVESRTPRGSKTALLQPSQESRVRRPASEIPDSRVLTPDS
ncbi:MAG: hypothetical protein U0793_31150 [Gemmataceae bacterium]